MNEYDRFGSHWYYDSIKSSKGTTGGTGYLMYESTRIKNRKKRKKK